MKIVNGMALPVFAYSDVSAKGYTNASSELYRFIVYVETDYDTDHDGKCDLVKTYVQVPRAAVEGAYKAPVLFQADSYSAGMRANFSNFKFANESVNDAALMTKPAHRTPDPSQAMTTQALALDTTLTKASDWNYELDGNEYPGGTTALDYYLVRGFAVVQAAGLGTYGSEGIECCGTVMERDAQAQLQGDYGPYWAARDWYTGQTSIRASALIVTGLNDANVSTKHFDLMRNAFIASGARG